MRPVSYTWDNAMVEGRRRLALLEHSLDPSTFRRLEGIGVAPGWRWLDVGAGGGTVCEWLCRRVAPTGQVTAMDLDTRFQRSLDLANLDVREENIVDADRELAELDDPTQLFVSPMTIAVIASKA
jgi:2-polyprenyl-3-methyl-5-hydroxy-6-metoxy-1,4-benzoquinol methylase